MATADARVFILAAAACRLYFWLRDSSGALQTGKTCTITASKDGAAFSAQGWTVTEVGGGQYYAETTTAADTTASHVGIKITAAGCVDVTLDIYPDDGGDLPVNVAYWRGTQPNTLNSGKVSAHADSLAAGSITASAIASNAIDADAISPDFGTEIADALKGAIVESQGSITLQQAMSLMLAVLVGRTSNSGNTFATPNNAATRVAATTDASGNRTAITITPSA